MKAREKPRCPDMRVLIDQFVVDDISSLDRRLVEEHLQLCSGCREHWKARRDLWRSVMAVSTPAPSQALIQKTTRAVVAGMSRRGPILVRPVPRILAIAASLILAFGLGFVTSSTVLDRQLGEPMAGEMGEPVVAPALTINETVDPMLLWDWTATGAARPGRFADTKSPAAGPNEETDPTDDVVNVDWEH